MLYHMEFAPDPSLFSFSSDLRAFRGEVIGKVHALRRHLLSSPIEEIIEIVSQHGSDVWEQDPLIIDAMKSRLGGNLIAGLTHENRTLFDLLPGVRESFKDFYKACVASPPYPTQLTALSSPRPLDLSLSVP